MDVKQLLTEFGLTGQEAAIYLMLIKEGSSNGYEVAKITGISRSNTYSALNSLVEKGAAYMIEGPVTRYTPITPEEFCSNKIRAMEKFKEDILKKMPEQKEDVEGYMTIRGEKHILDKVRNMISEAKERVYLSASNEILQCLAEDIKQAINRSIKIVIITNIPVSIGGATVYIDEKSDRRLGIIADSSNVLTGDLEDGEYSTCLYSGKKNLIDLFKESMRNEIKLIEIMKGKEPR